MKFVWFANLKPTWDIVKFDEGIEDIPCISKNGHRKQKRQAEEAKKKEQTL